MILVIVLSVSHSDDSIYVRKATTIEQLLPLMCCLNCSRCVLVSVLACRVVARKKRLAAVHSCCDTLYRSSSVQRGIFRRTYYPESRLVEKIVDLIYEIDGIDISWLAVYAHKHIIIIGSIYHSPDDMYDNIDLHIINEQMEIIKDRFKNENRKICFLLNGDFNAKNLIWGSSRTDNRGLNLANWIAQYDMDYLNDGSPTYKNPVSET